MKVYLGTTDFVWSSWMSLHSEDFFKQARMGALMALPQVPSCRAFNSAF